MSREAKIGGNDDGSDGNANGETRAQGRICGQTASGGRYAKKRGGGYVAEFDEEAAQVVCGEG